jgi:alanyl-tRNA synthetase
MAREFGLRIDRKGFNAEMEQQRSRARASWRGTDRAQIPEVYKSLAASEFVRDTFELPVTVEHVIVDGKEVAEASSGSADLVFRRTPFYAESGGQVGDSGMLLDPETREIVAYVRNVRRATPNVIAHRVDVMRPLRKGMPALAVVDPARSSTMRNHTATHLLHAALRQVLGPHVKQAGSVVEPGRLRFDFTHYAALTPDEISEVERLVNQQILSNEQVQTDLMDLDRALSTGAMALFGEKYGDTVRVVSIPGFSRELCGGTHVKRTGDIGLFKIVYEGSISAGVRRIEAVTGEGALERFQEATAQLARASQLLHASHSGFLEHLEKTLENTRTLEREVNALKTKLAQQEMERFEGRKVGEITVVAERVEGLDSKQLRTMADALRNKHRNAVVVMASVNDGRIAVIAAVSKELTSKVQAGKLVGEVAQAIGGKGGGRPDLAEGAGKDVDKLEPALQNVYGKVEALLAS